MTTADTGATAASVLAFLIEAGLRGLAVAAAGGAALAILRPRRAAVSLGWWTLVLYAALAIPALDRALPRVRVPLPVAPAPLMHVATMPTPPAPAMAAPSRTPAPAAPEAIAALLAAHTSAAAAPADPISWRLSPTLVVICLYALGLAGLLASGALGWWMTRRLERRARPIVDAAALARLRSHAAAAGLGRAPRLAESSHLRVPVTSSVLRPVILFPTGWRQWSGATMEAVLQHEMAHISRRDALTQRLSLAYRAVFWPNPFAWWLHRRLAALAERASDEAALESGIDRTAYAETLLGFFAELQVSRGSRAMWHVAMARGARAERRVEHILEWERGRARTATTRWAVVAALAMAPALALAASMDPVRVSPTATRPIAPVSTTVAAHDGVTAHRAAMAPASHSIATTEESSAPQTAAPLTPAAPGLGDAGQGPLTSEQVAGHRVWILLYDVASMQTADLQRAVDGTMKWVDEKMTANDLVAVASISPSRLDIVQDFTNDQAKVKASIANLGPAAPASAGTDASLQELKTFQANMRLRALKTLCDGVLTIQQHKTILYFTNGQGSGQDNAVETQAVENACARASTSIDQVDTRGLQVMVEGGSPRTPGVTSLVVPGASLLPPAQAPGVGLELAIKQQDSPVTLVSSTSNVTDGAYVTVTVRNDTTRIVRSVTVAAIVRSAGAYYYHGDPFQVFSSPPLGTWIPPAESRTLESHVIDMNTLQSFATGASATLGVVAVDFSDGSTWRYDVRAKGGFEATAPVPGLIRRPGSGAVSPQPTSRVDPKYTAAAWRARVQGDVEVDAVVLPDGSVGDVTITKRLDPGLDAQAVLAAKQWKFRPALFQGAPVSMIVGIIVEFRLPANGQAPPLAAESPVTGMRLGTPGFVAPVVIKRVDPKYTPGAITAKLEGTVLLDVQVLKDGAVGDVRVTRPLDPGLDEEAVKAAKQYLFKPGTVNGQPVDSVVTISMEFRIRGGRPDWPQAYPLSTPGLIAPVATHGVDPKYTSDAMRAKLQGDVDVEALVGADGTVIDARIIKSLDAQFGLDAEAVAAAKQTKFRPALLNGQPVAAIVTLVLHFRLH